MKYTVEGFSQARLIELGLDYADALLLRWLVDWIAADTMETVEHDGRIYHWVRHAHVADQLPILGILNTRAMGRRFQKLVDAGVLLAHLTHEKNGAGGRFTFYCTGPEYESLISSQTKENTPDGARYSKVPRQGTRKSPGKVLKSTNKDSSIRDSSIREEEGATPPAPPPRSEPDPEPQIPPDLKHTPAIATDTLRQWTESITDLELLADANSLRELNNLHEPLEILRAALQEWIRLERPGTAKKLAWFLKQRQPYLDRAKRAHEARRAELRRSAELSAEYDQVRQDIVDLSPEEQRFVEDQIAEIKSRFRI